MRRLALFVAIGLAACGGDDDPDVEPPAGAEVITIAPGSSADFQDGDVTVTVGEIDGGSVTVTAEAGRDEVSIEGGPGARDDVGEFEIVVTDVDDDEVTIAVGEGG